MTDDCLILKGMVFWANHGGLPEEEVLGQKFEVDLEVCYDMAAACVSDDLAKSFNYKHVYEIVAKAVTATRFNLLQALAEHIARQLIAARPDVRVTVTVKKPGSPVGGIFDYAAVRLIRTAETLTIAR